MAIFDCFQYFNEEHIVDLRLNILDQYVDNFVIVFVTFWILNNLKFSATSESIRNISLFDVPININSRRNVSVLLP